MSNKPHLSQAFIEELKEQVVQATEEAFQESLEVGLTVIGMNDKGQVIRYHPDGQEELQGTLQ